MAPKEKRRYISFHKVDNFVRERHLFARFRRTREYCTETCVRLWRFTRFFVVCSASLFQALAPWMLSVAEVLVVLLLYFLGTSRALVVHEKPTRYHFRYRYRLEDVVILACMRAVILSFAYAWGAGRQYHRPYLWTSYALAAVAFPYTLVKACLFQYTRHKDWPVDITLFIIVASFSWFHVIAARRTVDWARRRYQMGLLGFGYPWEEGEEAWALLGTNLMESNTKCGSDGGPAADQDMPADVLADPDSKFIEVDGIKVHYKEVAPMQGSQQDEVGIVLVHGFGGGVFAWRHMLEPLAMQLQCRVVAMDRPAFGLTSRPAVTSERDNPYMVTSQAHLLIDFSSAIGLRKVVFVAHADGCLLSILAAGLACRMHSGRCSPTQRSSLSRSQSAAAALCRASSLVAELPPIQPSFKSLPSAVPPIPPAPSPRPRSAAGPVAMGPVASASDATEQPAVDAHPVGVAMTRNRTTESGASSPTAMESLMRPLLAGKSQSALRLGWTGDGGEVACDSPDEEGTDASTSTAPPLPPRGSTDTTTASPSSTIEIRTSKPPAVLALALLHPNMNSNNAATFTRLLAKSKLGKSILRPLLRSEIGEVANRRAWYNTDKLTNEVLELYKTPLRVEGWDTALLETTRLKKEYNPNDMNRLFAEVQSVPCFLVTGEHDRIVPAASAEGIASKLPGSRLAVVPNCGHLSHEETPSALLELLVPFCGEALLRVQR